MEDRKELDAIRRDLEALGRRVEDACIALDDPGRGGNDVSQAIIACRRVANSGDLPDHAVSAIESCVSLLGHYDTGETVPHLEVA